MERSAANSASATVPERTSSLGWQAAKIRVRLAFFGVGIIGVMKTLPAPAENDLYGPIPVIVEII
jgi:hypothetical protein